MRVGSYIDGRTVDYDETMYQFAIGGVPVTFPSMRAYDCAGQVTWRTVELRDWFHSIDQNAFITANLNAVAQYVPAPAVSSAQRAPIPPTQQPQAPSKNNTGLIVAVVIGVALTIACFCLTMFFATQMIATSFNESPNYGTTLTDEDYGYGFGYGYDGLDDGMGSSGQGVDDTF